MKRKKWYFYSAKKIYRLTLFDMSSTITKIIKSFLTNLTSIRLFSSMRSNVFFHMLFCITSLRTYWAAKIPLTIFDGRILQWICKPILKKIYILYLLSSLKITTRQNISKVLFLFIYFIICSIIIEHIMKMFLFTQHKLLLIMTSNQRIIRMNSAYMSSTMYFLWKSFWTVRAGVRFLSCVS